jgi:hypothetical protein
MPSTETLDRFVALVESNAHAEAVEAFYAADATLRENHEPPRVGRAVHAAQERKMLARARAVHSCCVRPVFVHGDRVVIRWQFRFDWLDGTVTEMEELAYQQWDGDTIVAEQFFYDPVQRVPRPA